MADDAKRTPAPHPGMGAAKKAGEKIRAAKLLAAEKLRNREKAAKRA